MKFWLRRKWHQVKMLRKYIPIIWKSYDFDYRYSTEIFKLHLEDLGKMMESNRAYTESAGFNANKIKIAVKLMTKVYDEDYAMAYSKIVEKKYGKSEFKFIDTGEGNGNSYMEITYGGKEETAEIRKFVSNEMMIAHEQQEKAHRILWDFIAHNIRNWWD